MPSTSYTPKKSEITYLKNRLHKQTLTKERLRYIRVLIQEFNHRRTANISYSMRAFARDLEIDQKHLLRIFKNQKGLSPQKAELISMKLSLKFSDRRKFIQLVAASSARRRSSRNLARMGLQNAIIRKHLSLKI